MDETLLALADALDTHKKEILTLKDNLAKTITQADKQELQTQIADSYKAVEMLISNAISKIKYPTIDTESISNQAYEIAQLTAAEYVAKMRNDVYESLKNDVAAVNELKSEGIVGTATATSTTITANLATETLAGYVTYDNYTLVAGNTVLDSSTGNIYTVQASGAGVLTNPMTVGWRACNPTHGVRSNFVFYKPTSGSTVVMTTGAGVASGIKYVNSTYTEYTTVQLKLAQMGGALSTLNTTTKASLIAAINELVVTTNGSIYQSDGGFSNVIPFNAAKHTLLADCTTNGALQVVMPSPATYSGMSFTIKKIDSTVNGTVTLMPNGSETFDGAASLVLTTQWAKVTVQTNGTNWFVVA